MEAHRLLHGHKGQKLDEVVLDDVTHDAKLIKVAAAALGTKVLLRVETHGREIGACVEGKEG